MSDLLICNATLAEGRVEDILVREGRIAAVGANLSAPAELARYDAAGRTVLPGAIDMHVHFRQPGGEHKETLVSGARAAVKGGTTTCGDMPNTSPRTTTLAALEQKVAWAADAPANLFFNFGAEPDNLADVRTAAAHPAVKALKIYMGPSTGQGGLAPPSVEAHFRQAADLGLTVMVHAEDLEEIQANDTRYPHDVRHHHQLRSSPGELAAVKQALDWARTYGVRLYLAHCTQAEAIRLAEDSGIRDQVFIEVCPHHLLLAVEDIADPVPNRYKVNPPLRTEVERQALFDRLQTGIDGLGSDHAPHTLAEKDAPYDRAPSGIPGVEALFPLAVDWWRRGTLSQERLVELTSAAAARWFRMDKGRVAVGADADLVLVDRDACWTVGQPDDPVVSQCGWTLYAGRELMGRPEVTFVRGRIVYERAGSMQNE